MEKKADLEKGVEEKEVEKKSLKSPKVDADLKNDQGNIQYGSVDADIALTYSDAMKPNKFIRICMLFKSLTIEPIMFSFSFAFVMNLSCLSNMMIDKGCVTYFNYSKEICGNLSAYPDAKDNVEKLATDYSMYFTMMSLIGAVAMIFIAPWSDKYGRKLPLFAAFFGITLSDIGLMICSWSLNSQMIYVVLSRIPGEIFGGFICVMTIIYSHASEVSSGARRTCKYTTVEIFFAMGMGLGGFCGGWVYHYYGYFYIYAIATAIHVACLPWIVFVVQETTGQNSRATWREKIRNFFVCENLLKGWKAAVRSRENSGRALILLLFGSMCVIVLTYESLSSIAFIYVHHIYDWKSTTYNNVNTIFTLSQIVVLSIIMTLLIRFFQSRIILLE
ncbi:uncharacterized protein CEXT_808951 [Caerostris extrusa]|uniref:Major facilitator superfamily (MFS) profile domain-containing protein n=1 Tax=Caerostris extrusa TaxID=172846 RepID=A0AAV4TEV0_CAEEX|nr:uncharacterized protein CEXT_808951 [Caerostris extrusa]